MPQHSEPSWADPTSTKKLPWYADNIDKHLTPAISKLLSEYSNIPKEEQSAHVHFIRDKAWAIRTYPCTGLGVWLTPYIDHSPEYKQILQRLRDGEIMLDVGCFIGGDFRRCVFDGAPSKDMIGMDIVSHWNVGYELFQDRGRFEGKFVEADLLKVGTGEEPEEVKALKGKVGILHVSALLHQWDWDTQVEAAKKLVFFTKPGTLIVGHQIGMHVARNIDFQNTGSMRFNQSPDSLQQLMKDVGEATGTKWKVQGWVRDWEFLDLTGLDVKFMHEDQRPIDFVFERVE